MKNIVIFGCRKIAIDIIYHIINNYSDRCTITGIVTHDEERDRIYHKMLVSEYCDELGLPWIRFDKKIDKNVISGFNPDLILSLYYRKILKKEVLDIPDMGCINIHPAFLPEGRGPAPSLWNVLGGDKYAGSTMHYMAEGVDAGDIIAQKKIEICGRTGFNLNVCLSDVGFETFKDNFNDILSGINKRVPQDHSKGVYCLPFKTSLRYIFWDKPEYILNQLRAFAKPFDGAKTWTARGDSVIIWKAHKLSKRESFSAPGFFEKNNDGLLVQTCTLPLLVTKWEVISGNIKDKGRFISGPPVT